MTTAESDLVEGLAFQHVMMRVFFLSEACVAGVGVLAEVLGMRTEAPCADLVIGQEAPLLRCIALFQKKAIGSEVILGAIMALQCVFGAFIGEVLAGAMAA